MSPATKPIYIYLLRIKWFMVKIIEISNFYKLKKIISKHLSFLFTKV